MKRLDVVLQNWRIRKVRPWLPKGARLLDIGTASGAIFTEVTTLEGGVGIDPDLTDVSRIRSNVLVPGTFPEALPDDQPFDAITMLAVLEHIPTAMQAPLARACFSAVRPGGHLLITVPSTAVDHVLAGLRFLHLIEGMSLEQHYGFDVAETPGIFGGAGFTLVERKTFQLGLNNFFAFQKPLR